MNVLWCVFEVNNNVFLITLEMAQCSGASLTVQLLGSFWLSFYQRISRALIFCLFVCVLQSVVKVKLFHMGAATTRWGFQTIFSRNREEPQTYKWEKQITDLSFTETIAFKICVSAKKREKSLLGLLSFSAKKKRTEKWATWWVWRN